VFADDWFTGGHVLEKVAVLIAGSEFAVFDVTGWNANVALELGIAMRGAGEYYILFNPAGGRVDVPSDLGGIDRLQYEDFAGLEEVVGRLLRQRFGVPAGEREGRGRVVSAQLSEIAREIPVVVGRCPGLTVGGIASRMAIPVLVAKPLVGTLVGGGEVRAVGVGRGTRYFPPGV